ncbi:TonB-dependent receptor [Fodinibius sp. AD559]|uniref:TonB-dependent receptor n=1 Tax=Fodinibius sp. AD559 TaxID=3424179 RepID=UPI004046A1D1
MTHLQFHIKRVVVLFLGVFFTVAVLPIQAHQGEQTVLKGTVLNEEGKPLHLAHVMIEGTSNGDVTDRQGRFQIEVSSSSSVVMVVSMVGYAPAKEEVNVEAAKTVEINFQLQRKQAKLDETTVTADAFTTGDTEGVTLSPTEVVTTPGAAADIFRSLQTFPGVSNMDEGSGLFVRGGDVSEVSFVLDQAPVIHPYKYERPTGGVFGTIPPFLVSGTYFSTGGFSAKYGNAMSAVLAMESKGMPDANQFDANIGMAALSAGGAIPIVSDKLGIRFSGNRSLSRFMFKVNGLVDEFEQAPMGANGNFSIIAKPYQGTTIKFFNYVKSNRVGVPVPRPSFDATYRSKEQNRLHNLQWKQLWGNWLVKTSASVNRYQNDRQLGGLDLNEADRAYKLRSDLEFSGFEDMVWYAGLEWGRFGNEFAGQLPGEKDILDPDADFYTIDEQYFTKRLGGYLESEYQLFPQLELRLGVRTDYENHAKEWTIDPRISLQYQTTNHSNIRLASGRYHQYAEPFQYNSATGNKTWAFSKPGTTLSDMNSGKTYFMSERRAITSRIVT